MRIRSKQDYPEKPDSESNPRYVGCGEADANETRSQSQTNWPEDQRGPWMVPPIRFPLFIRVSATTFTHGPPSDALVMRTLP